VPQNETPSCGPNRVARSGAPASSVGHGERSQLGNARGVFGGRGVVIGTLIVGVLRNGLVLTGVQSIYQVLITGILVILAVSVDRIARRRKT
jgi:predicted ABC-type sugar transport system permease subunit